MKPTTRDGILRGGSATSIRLLILVAAGISIYLLSVSLSGRNAVGCGPGSSCDEVLWSNWAYVLGIPVSALALLVDLTLLLTTFSCGAKSTPKQRRAAWEILIPCSLLVVGGAMWFVALQAAEPHRPTHHKQRTGDENLPRGAALSGRGLRAARKCGEQQREIDEQRERAHRDSQHV